MQANKFISSLLICLSLSLVVSPAFAYKNKRVVTIVNKEIQTDTFGFNVVTVYLSFIYQKIEEGKINLWDSPRKLSKINYLSLQEIENNSGTKFTNSANFFIYEIWSSSKHKTSFEIAGFAFVSQDKDGKDVNYGYLAYADVADYLKTNSPPACVDCISNLNFYDIFMNKMFSYDIIYFNDKLIISSKNKHPGKAYLKSLKIRQSAFNENKNNLNATPIINSRLITYKINKSDYNTGSQAILESLEDYFDLHRRELLNYGGISFIQDFRETDVIFTECTITELWTKKDNTLSSKLVSIYPSSFGNVFSTALTPFLIDSMGFKVDEMNFERYLQLKDFTYHLLSINGIIIEDGLSMLYLEGLLTKPWNHLSNYISAF